MNPLVTILVVVLAIGGLGTAAFLYFTRKIWFFRDPQHPGIESDESLILSPVYGVVAYIKPVKDGRVESNKKGETIPISDISKQDWPENSPSSDGWLVGIAMTALDVHFQYSSIPGKVKSIFHYQTGMNLPMFDLLEYVQITWLRTFVDLWCKRYILENERQTIWFEGSRCQLALILIADKFVSKISTYCHVGDALDQGQKLSFIARGSQVDILICGQPDIEFLVKPGDKVSGPKTRVARLK